jgi:hypothetical protein
LASGIKRLECQPSSCAARCTCPPPQRSRRAAASGGMPGGALGKGHGSRRGANHSEATARTPAPSAGVRSARRAACALAADEGPSLAPRLLADSRRPSARWRARRRAAAREIATAIRLCQRAIRFCLGRRQIGSVCAPPALARVPRRARADHLFGDTLRFRSQRSTVGGTRRRSSTSRTTRNFPARRSSLT